MRIPGALHLASVVALATTTLAAQTRVLVPEPAVCRTCRVEVTPPVPLDPAAYADGSLILNVQRDQRGRYWLFREARPPLVFDRSGRLLQTVGRTGSGPGEFRFAWRMLALPGDSVVIFDADTKRATVYTAALRLQRSFVATAPMSHSVVVRWPRAVLANVSTYYSPDSAGSLALVDFSGAQPVQRRAFGPRRSDRPNALPLSVHLTPPERGRFWTVESGNYEVGQWTTAGVPERSWYRQPSWLAVDRPMSRGSPTRPPMAVMAGIGRDAAGLLFIAANLPDSTWKQGWPATQPGQREVAGAAMDHDKLYRGLVEVLDPETGRVLARRSFDEHVIAMLPGPELVVERTDGDGVPTLSVLRLSLSR